MKSNDQDWDGSSRVQRLRDIVERGSAILATLDGISYDAFLADALRQKAVFFDFQCVSEATARLLDMDPTLIDRYPDIPWSQIRAIGNVIRHVYGKIDVEIIWETATGDRLKKFMRVTKRELEEA